MFFEKVASHALTITCVQVLLTSWVMMPWFGIDTAEADERLERRRRVDAVDVDLGEVVVEAAVRKRSADAHLPLQLPAVAHRVLVDVRLVQVLVEQQIADRRCVVGGVITVLRLPSGLM